MPEEREMVKLRVLFAWVAVLLGVLTACGGAAAPVEVAPPVAQTVVVETVTEDRGEAVVITEAVEIVVTAEPAAESEAPTANEESANEASGDEAIEAQQVNTQNIQTSDRKIIYTSSLVLEVDDPRQEAQALYGVALHYGALSAVQMFTNMEKI